MSKWLSTLSLLFVAVALISGCTKKSESNLKIGFILDNMNEERYAKDKKYFEDKAKSLGAEVVFASANSDSAAQMNKVENMLALGVKAIVMQPVDSNASASMVEAARKEKVPFIAYDRIINKAPIDLYVTQDSTLVGVLQAEAAVKATGGKGKYIILSGQEGHSVAEAITQGVKSVLAKYPEIELVVHQYHPGWDAQLALKTTENALTRFNNKIDAVLANNSGMAHGAVQAVAEQKLTGKVFIAGADADLAAIKDIVQGKQQFEVLKEIRPLAEKAAEAAVALAQGKPILHDRTIENGSGTEVKVINTPVYPVTVENLDERIFKSGFHDRALVFGDKKL